MSYPVEFYYGILVFIPFIFYLGSLNIVQLTKYMYEKRKKDAQDYERDYSWDARVFGGELIFLFVNILFFSGNLFVGGYN